jgi:O-antigen ligase
MAVVGVTVLVSGIFGWTYRDLLLSRTGVTGENVEMRSVADRLVFTLFAYRATQESTRNALYGIGAGNFPWRSSYYLVETDYDLRGNNVHHVFLSALVEVGLVGYAMLAAALVCGIEAALRQLRRLRRSEIRPLRDESVWRSALLAGFVALGIVGLFDHYPWTLLQFQVMWWGLLAACIRPADPHREAQSSVRT